MINFINSWVQGIIIAVLISTIIEMILPDGNIKKYVRTVIGTYIVVIIVSPIITKITGKDINLKSFELPEIQEKQETISIDTNAYIQDTYINKIKEDIIENIETKGYIVKKVIVKISEAEGNYGNINSIELEILKQEKYQGNIEPIEININGDTEQIENIDQNELQELKVFLQDTYGTENIEIIIN